MIRAHPPKVGAETLAARGLRPLGAPVKHEWMVPSLGDCSGEGLAEPCSVWAGPQHHCGGWHLASCAEGSSLLFDKSLNPLKLHLSNSTLFYKQELPLLLLAPTPN